MSFTEGNVVRKLVDDFMKYAADISDEWNNREAAQVVGRALVDSEDAVLQLVASTKGSDRLCDSKETRRFLGEIITGAACLQLLLSEVPDSRRKPARLTIITLLKQWCDRSKIFPVQ